jgi:Lrp/AsnC family transcriptional regulator
MANKQDFIPIMTSNIDEIDRRILNVLQLDASLSVDALADQVHLSRNACWRRVKALESAGVIRGRVALLDPDAVGLGLAVFVMVRTNRHDPDWLANFKAAVQQFPEIQGAHRMSGDLDYVLRVRVRDVGDYDRFYQRLIARVELADVSASFVMEDLKDTTALPI